MVCGNCEYNDKTVYTSLPPMMKCTITKEYHRYDHTCELEFVPVVRCKECKWWKELEDVKGLNFCTYVIGAEFVREGVDYCSRGERRKNAID